MEKTKEKFGSKIGFVLAAAGSAVGLGNLWRFPYLAAKYGGGVFLITYIVFAVTFGFALMITEVAIGRKTGKSVIGAYKSMNKKFAFLGWIAAFVPVIIVPYYCVIGGWVIKYFTMFVSGNGAVAATGADFFTSFISGATDPTIYFLIFVALTTIAIVLGVQKGIEKLSKIMMPLLLLLIIGIAIFTLLQPGALKGLKYYLLPDFTGFTLNKALETIIAAMGQLFYSMSLAMGIMITYGSYMRKEDSLEKSVRQISLFDTAIAILAGLVIVPAVFVFSGGTNLDAGPSLMFITLPQVFKNMPAGDIIGTAFFLLVILAALTSSISLMETVTSIISEKFKLKRFISAMISLAIIIVLGLVSIFGYSIWSHITILGYQLLDFFDFISNNIIMPIVAFLTCILVGYIVKPKFVEDEVLVSQDSFKVSGLYRVMILAICPICMIIILISPFILSI